MANKIIKKKAIKKSGKKNPPILKVGTQLITKTNNDSSFYIVGLGTSAGGLEALELFFSNCPSDTGLAFIIVQHLSPDYKSLMPELLSRHTKMKVTEAKDKVLVKPNHVYLIPGSKNLTIKDGKLHLTKRPPSSTMNFSIDIFFNSLALEQKERAIGIILSGTGSDGTRGGKSLKEVGGTMFIQNPDDARFDGMPRSAINGGLADFILTAAEMPSELIQFVSHPQFAKTITGVELGKNLESIDRILKIVKNHTGYDFFSYKKPTLLRRTAKRMNITKCDTAEDYIDFLYDNPDEKFTLVDEFLIGVTKFFRDPVAYQILENQVIPDIIEEKRSRGHAIKVWVVACSTGEEAYSLAILFEEYLATKNFNLKYKIFATDIDSKAIDVAAKGFYSENIATDVSQQRLSTYFIRKENGFQIQPSVRKNIIFSKHDILQHPPFNKMDLISCRNMLIYIDNNVQLKVLSSLHYALNKNGYLFMGSSESIGILNKNFTEINSKWKIYRNVLPTKMVNVDANAWRIEDRTTGTAKRSRQTITLEDKVIKAVNRDLMTEMEAVCVCVDEHFDIVYASGKFKKYVTMPDEGFSNNITKLLSDDLVIPITTAVRKLVKNESETIVKNVVTQKDKMIQNLRLMIKVLPLDLATYRSYLITIIEKAERPLTEEEQTNDLPPMSLNREEVDELKEALDETRENLQSTIEELETSNEEMQATNEELLASNEELQSTNEELQSLNEELHTVNAELQEKNLQLLEANSDIENLMVNTNIGTIFLDREFNIRKFTPAIKEHFHLRDDDIGRPIGHFSGSTGGNDLVKYATKVLKKLIPFRLEFQNKEGTWFMLQIFPYQSQNNTIQGVVVNFINIDQLKKTADEKAALDNYIVYLTQKSPVTIYVHDVKKQKNSFTTKSLWETAGYSREEAASMYPDLLSNIIHPDDYKKAMDHYNKKVKQLKDQEELTLEYRIIHKKTRAFIWIRATDKVHERDHKGKVLSILGVRQDISHTKLMEEQIRENQERSRIAIQGTGAAMWEWSDLEKDDAWWSPEFYKLLGYSPRKLKASYGAMLTFMHQEHVELFQEKLEKHLTHKVPFEIKLQLKTKKRGYRWFKINLQAQWDANGKATKIVGVLFDINEARQLVTKIKEKQARLSAIYNSVLTGITLTDNKGKFVEVSEGINLILGYSPKDLIGKSFMDITYPEDHGISTDQFKKLKKGTIPFMRVDKRYICKDKSTKWSDSIISKVIISGNDYYLCVMVDINKRKLAEDKMIQLNKELERFAYLASHDLKEPLRTITSVTERLKEKHGEGMNANALQYIQFIEEASNRMQNVTSGLLIHSELGRKIQRYQTINLNQLIKSTRSDLATSIAESGATFKIKRLPKIMGDPMQISLLFQNLISNSIKYRKKRTPLTIEIGYENKGNHWEFFVADNGIGIAKANQEKIFEVFRRLHNKDEYEGMGIGLSSCKRIVENHKGEIWAKSKVRKGSTFYFTIPKKQPS